MAAFVVTDLRQRTVLRFYKEGLGYDLTSHLPMTIIDMSAFFVPVPCLTTQVRPEVELRSVPGGNYALLVYKR